MRFTIEVMSTEMHPKDNWKEVIVERQGNIHGNLVKGASFSRAINLIENVNISYSV
jgi:hypothetical protein